MTSWCSERREYLKLIPTSGRSLKIPNMLLIPVEWCTGDKSCSYRQMRMEVTIGPAPLARHSPGLKSSCPCSRHQVPDEPLVAARRHSHWNVEFNVRDRGLHHIKFHKSEHRETRNGLLKLSLYCVPSEVQVSLQKKVKPITSYLWIVSRCRNAVRRFVMIPVA